MKSSIEWLDGAMNAAPEERASVADLQLFIKNQNVTLHLLDGKLEQSITVALYGLVNGLVHDWWRIFGGRNQEAGFSLKKYREGYLFPDIRMRFDGSVFEVSALQHVYENPDLRFWGGATEVMSRVECQKQLSDLVETVLSRLADKGLEATSAKLRWERIQQSMQSDEKFFCEAAGSLGLDPYQITDEAANFIESAEKLFFGEALVEFVAGSDGVDKPELIAWSNKVHKKPTPNFRLNMLRAFANEIAEKAPLKTEERGWSRGYRSARIARRKLQLGQDHRFTSFRDLAMIFDASHTYSLAGKVNGIHAMRSEHADGVYIHVRNHGDAPEAKASHLFVMARAIGDVICFPEPQTAPINGLKNAFRQAAGRAFAAEFLAPIHEINSMRADKHDIDSIADEFGVSTRIIERQIENQERIDEACS